MLSHVQTLLDQGPTDISSAAIERLREHRDACQTVESSLSYGRRMVQGRLDIVASELEQRRSGEPSGDLADLIGRLPEILAERDRASQVGARAVTSLGPDSFDTELDSELDKIVGGETLATLADLDQQELVGILGRLSDFEHSISNERRSLHDRIDAIQTEIAARYERGEVTVDSLLGS